MNMKYVYYKWIEYNLIYKKKHNRMGYEKMYKKMQNRRKKKKLEKTMKNNIK